MNTEDKPFHVINLSYNWDGKEAKITKAKCDHCQRFVSIEDTRYVNFNTLCAQCLLLPNVVQ